VKGVSDIAVHFVFIMIVVLTLLGFAFSHSNMVQKLLAEKTTKVVAHRIAADVKILQSYPDGGKVEVDLYQDYNISTNRTVPGADDLDVRQDEISMLNVTYKDSTSSIPVQATLETSQQTTILPGVSTRNEYRFYCLEKQSQNILIKGGAC
jgi:hypothetical protein